jgi:hypothetical protein
MFVDFVVAKIDPVVGFGRVKLQLQFATIK